MNEINNTIKTRVIYDYRPETLSLLAALQTAGFSIIEGSNDGGDTMFPHVKPDEFLDELMGADEALMYVRPPDSQKRLALHLVYGNEPGELVSDNTCHDLLDDVLQKVSDEWQGKPQPVREVRY
jgi:hypothetical protein